MTENEKRYEDFIRALNELCQSYGVGLGVAPNDMMAVWSRSDSDAGLMDYIENRLDK